MEKLSLKQVAYLTIKQKIINCEYMPNTFLNEARLMEEIGASRTPIREAVSRLEQEKLVSIIPKKGVVVSGMTLQEINSIYETRELIECFIIEKYGDRVSRPKLRRLQEEMMTDVDAHSKEWHSKIDNDFHSELLYSCDNSYFHQVMEQTYAQNHRMRILSGRDAVQRLPRTRQEHIEIIQCLQQNDYQGASAAMRLHLQHAKQGIMNVLINYAAYVGL